VEHLIVTWGYVAIFGLSIAQSACVPTSSELTFGFAGFLAYSGHFNLLAVILVGALGELFGAYIAWAFGYTGGRTLVLRYGGYVRVDQRQLDRLQAWYGRHPRWGVFASRLLPVVRNFVALAAGLGEVPPLAFGVLTFLGSLVWDGGLTLLGYSVGSAWHQMVHTVSDVGYGVVALIVVVAVLLVIGHRAGSRSLKTLSSPSGESSVITTLESYHNTNLPRAEEDDPSGYLTALNKIARAKPVQNKDPGERKAPAGRERKSKR